MLTGIPHIVRLGLIMLVLSVAAQTAIAPSVSSQSCSSLQVRSDKQTYSLGEVANIAVNFNAALPGCFQPMIAYQYVVGIQILNNTKNVQYSSNHTTSGSIMIHQLWIPTERGDYEIKASSWFGLAGNDILVESMENSTSIVVQ